MLQAVEEIDDEKPPPTPSTHGTFDEKEDEARRNESAEIVVRDDTANFLSDSYSETEEVPDDDKEEGEGEEEYKEKRGLTTRMKMQSSLRRRQQAQHPCPYLRYLPYKTLPLAQVQPLCLPLRLFNGERKGIDTDITVYSCIKQC